MQVETITGWVADAIDFLFAGYPGATRGWTPQQHRDNKRVYSEILTRSPQECAAAIVKRTHADHPKWPPTAGQLREIASLVFADWQRNQSRPQTKPDRLIEEKIIPLTRENRERYINHGNPNKYERLERTWEVENKEGVTDEMRAKRAAQLGEILAQVGS